MNKILQGDCLDKLKELESESVDSIVTDPPAGISFMGKSWDSDKGGRNHWIAWMSEVATECKRVLKPGGHAFVWAIPRTSHWTATAWENAGFEIRDVVAHVFGSGFPKSLSVGKAINKLETNEWSKIGKALDNIDQKSIMEVWKSNSDNVKIVETQLSKKPIIAGQDMQSENFVLVNAVENTNQESSSLLVSFVIQNLSEAQVIDTRINTVLQNVEAEIRQSQSNVKSAEKRLQEQSHYLSTKELESLMSIFTAECDVKEWLKENTEVNHKVDEALKTLRGNKKYSDEEITNVLCAVLTENLLHTILSQSKTFQSLDTKSKTECASVINVIITEYTAECLISNTVDILKIKSVDKLQGNERESIGKYEIGGMTPDRENFGANDRSGGKGMGFRPGEIKITKGTSEWEGWGTALKPAHEPICMARKPLGYWKVENTLTQKEKNEFQDLWDRMEEGMPYDEKRYEDLWAKKEAKVFKPLNVAQNVLKYGTGGINIDESRVGLDKTDSNWRDNATTRNDTKNTEAYGKFNEIKAQNLKEEGRFPANLILSWNSDEYMLKLDVSVDDLIKLKKHYERPQDLQENMGENTQ